MVGEDRGRRLRSFLVGSVLGASAALAAARRKRPGGRARHTPAGLAAFEGAPCFQETLEREATAADESRTAR